MILVIALQKVISYKGILITMGSQGTFQLLHLQLYTYTYYVINQYNCFVGKQPTLVIDERQSRTDGVSGACVYT